MGLSCVQVEGPPNPSALARTQTSFRHMGGQDPESPEPLNPPNTIIRLLAVLKTALCKILTAGGPPTGLSSVHVCAPAWPTSAKPRRRIPPSNALNIPLVFFMTLSLPPILGNGR